MRHLKSGRKLSRTASHRKAMLANLTTSILDKERVSTTVAKAKEVRSVVERQITYAKEGSLHSVRLASKTVSDKTVLKKLFDEIGPGFKSREGGYVRIVKTVDRDGDNAPMCIIELVGRGDDDTKRKPKRKKAPAKKPARPSGGETKVGKVEPAKGSGKADKGDAVEPAVDSSPDTQKAE